MFILNFVCCWNFFLEDSSFPHAFVQFNTTQWEFVGFDDIETCFLGSLCCAFDVKIFMVNVFLKLLSSLFAFINFSFTMARASVSLAGC